jgi:hypothetical protein
MIRAAHQLRSRFAQASIPHSLRNPRRVPSLSFRINGTIDVHSLLTPRRPLPVEFFGAADKFPSANPSSGSVRRRLRGRGSCDYIVPRSRGERTSWEEVVTAGQGCNLAKRNHLLSESGMSLLRRVAEPTTYELQENGRSFPPIFVHESW